MSSFNLWFIVQVVHMKKLERRKERRGEVHNKVSEAVKLS
jgi:hypothetical protein